MLLGVLVLGEASGVAWGGVGKLAGGSPDCKHPSHHSCNKVEKGAWQRKSWSLKSRTGKDRRKVGGGEAREREMMKVETEMWRKGPLM